MADKQNISDDIQFVKCPECGQEAPDFGASVVCEHCGFGPMPYYDDNGNLVE